MITRHELNQIDLKSLTLPQARVLINKMRLDIFELFKERQCAIKTANKFGDQTHIAFNFICRERDKIDDKVFTIRDFLLESDKVLAKIYRRGLEETTFVKRCGRIRGLGKKRRCRK